MPYIEGFNATISYSYSFFYVRQLSDGTIMQVDADTAAKFASREGYQVIESERALDVK